MMGAEYSPHPHQSSPTLARRACLSCQQRKRKCDKSLPSCQTCIKIGRLCRYSQTSPSVSRPSTQNDDDLSMLAPDSPQTGCQDVSRWLPSLASRSRAADIFIEPSLLLPPFLSHDPFRQAELRQSIVDVTVTKEVSKILGTVDDLRAVALNYFSTIHPWMPMISKIRFYERIPRAWIEPHAEFVLLVFCMFLIIQVPSEEVHESMQSSLYAMAKALIALVESAGLLSVEVVQSRLLVSLFEMGHAIEPAAYISVGACARSGIALGIQETLHQQAPRDLEAWIKFEEERRVWWGIVILDRFVNLESARRSLAIDDPTPCDCLPVDDDAWDNNVMPLRGPLPMSTSTSVRVGCFAREAQLSHLLGRLLRHVYDVSPDLAFNEEEALQLHRTLDAMTNLLPVEVGTCAVYTSALALNYSARLLFERSPYFLQMHGHERYSVDTLELIERSARRVVAIACEGIHRAECGSPVPFGAYSFFQAATMRFRSAAETGDLLHLDSARLLQSALRHLDKRWKVAGKYLEAIQNLERLSHVVRADLQ